MCGWLNTSDPSGLIRSLHRQPVLAVLRPVDLAQARHQLRQLQQAGLLHVELAVHPDPAWVAMMRRLAAEFPSLRLGAASVCTSEALDAVLEAGLQYAVSPIVDRHLLSRAMAAGITLVPGVLSPTEVVVARQSGATAVKLFPAASVGPAYWSSLAGPLQPLPFCVAAGGLALADVPVWIEAGVDAVALGSQLFVHEQGDLVLEPGLPRLLAWLRQRAKH